MHAPCTSCTGYLCKVWKLLPAQGELIWHEPCHLCTTLSDSKKVLSFSLPSFHFNFTKHRSPRKWELPLPLSHPKTPLFLTTLINTRFISPKFLNQFLKFHFKDLNSHQFSDVYLDPSDLATEETREHRQRNQGSRVEFKSRLVSPTKARFFHYAILVSNTLYFSTLYLPCLRYVC